MENLDQSELKDLDRVPDAIQSNMEKVEQFEKREDKKRSHAQRLIEHVSVSFSSPRFLIYFVVITIVWILSDFSWHWSGHPYFDEPPFPVLQGSVTYVGVLITMAVLVRQNRLAQVAESRAHLELQVNLLAEQKATKIIMLLEELRRDLPNVANRYDEHAKTLEAMKNPDDVLAEIESRRNGPDAEKSAAMPPSGDAG